MAAARRVGSQVVVRADIDQDRRSAAEVDGRQGGDKGMRHGDDLIPGADSQGLQGQQQGIGAVADPDCKPHAEIVRHPLFKFPHLVAEDVLPA